jgi:monoamine oxidase
VTGARADVIVIGGGVAGLRAATGVAEGGFRVALLEGRDRLGGRIDTRHQAGWPPIEAGAEFVHGKPPVIERVRRRLGVRRQEHEERHLLLDGGRLRRADRDWEQAMALFEHLPRQPPDRSYAALAREPGWRRLAGPPVQQLARSFVEGFNAAPADEIGAVALGQQTDASAAIDGDRLFRFPGGYGQLVEALLQDALRAEVQVRTGATVTALDWAPGTIEVRAIGPAGDRLPPVRARAAVIALPLGVLKARPPAPAAVRFRPALPAHTRQAIQRLGFGPVLRLALRFDARTPGIRRGGFTFLHVPGGAFPTFWKLPAVGAVAGTTLIAWAAGPAAARLEGRTPERRLLAALRALATGLQVPPARLRAGLEGWRLFDWQQDPYARGAYSFAPPGGADLPRQLGLPVEDTLFFAGEAVHPGGASGTVHGAMETGDRAARLVIQALGAGRGRAGA